MNFQKKKNSGYDIDNSFILIDYYHIFFYNFFLSLFYNLNHIIKLSNLAELINRV
jgi:hypothetical protein